MKIGDKFIYIYKDRHLGCYKGDILKLEAEPDSDLPFFKNLSRETGFESVALYKDWVMPVNNESSTEKSEEERQVNTTMQKYNKGDEVELRDELYIVQCWSDDKGDGIMTRKGTEPSIYEDCRLCDQDHFHGQWMQINRDRIRLVSPAKQGMTNLNKLTSEQKAGLSKENQALLELGLVSQDLTPNETGFERLRVHLFAQEREALAKKAIVEVAEAKAELKKVAKA